MAAPGALLGALPEEGFVLAFSGQGFPWWPTLRDHTPTGSRLRRDLAQLVADSSDLLLPVHDTLLARTPRPFAPFTWRPGRTPPERDLDAMPLSVPGIFLAQVAVLHHLEAAGLDATGARGAVGHSQGRFAVRYLAERSRGAEILAVSRLIGAAMPRVGTAAGLAATRDGSPMVAVSGVPEEAVRHALDRVAPGAVVGLRNSPRDVTVVGPPEELRHLPGALPAARVVPLPVSVAAHHPGMQPAVEQAVRWAAACGLDTTLARELATHVLVDRVDWPADLSAVPRSGARWLLDLGPAQGMAALSARTLRGAGVGVLSVATPRGQEMLLSTRPRPPHPWGEWAPRRAADGTVGTRVTDLTGLRPVVVTSTDPFPLSADIPATHRLDRGAHPWRTVATAAELDAALRKAAAAPAQPLVLHVTAETPTALGLLLRPVYHRIRELPGVILLVRPGVLAPKDTVDWLTGAWARREGDRPMPCDAVEIDAVATLATRYAPARRAALREAVGESGPVWPDGAVLPFFGELRDMTYLEWLERHLGLHPTGTPDPLLPRLLDRLEARLSHVDRGPVERRLAPAADLPAQVHEHYPQAATTLLTPEDVRWFTDAAADYPHYLVTDDEAARQRWTTAVTRASADPTVPVTEVHMPAGVRQALALPDELGDDLGEYLRRCEERLAGCRGLSARPRRLPPTTLPPAPVPASVLPQPPAAAAPDTPPRPTGVEEISALVLGPDGVLAAAARQLLTVVDRPARPLTAPATDLTPLLTSQLGPAWRDMLTGIFTVDEVAGEEIPGGGVTVLTGARAQGPVGQLCGDLLAAGRDVVAVVDPWDADVHTAAAFRRLHPGAGGRLWRVAANLAAASDRRELISLLRPLHPTALYAFSGLDGPDETWRVHCAVDATAELFPAFARPATLVLPGNTGHTGHPATSRIRSGHLLLERRWAGEATVRRHDLPTPPRGTVAALPTPPCTGLPAERPCLVAPGAPWARTVVVAGHGPDPAEALRRAGLPPADTPAAAASLDAALLRLHTRCAPVMTVAGTPHLVLATAAHAREAGLPVWATLTTAPTPATARVDVGLAATHPAPAGELATLLAKQHDGWVGEQGLGHLLGPPHLFTSRLPDPEAWRERARRALQTATRSMLENAQ